MIKKKKNILFILFILVFLSITSLNLSLNTKSTQDIHHINNSAGTNSYPEESVFIRAVSSGPTVLDPVDCWERMGSEVIRQVTETLWFYNWSDPGLPRINMLAESEFWVSDTQLRVNLRQGINFHDGTPFNATAAKWNLDRLMYLFNHSGLLPSYERIANPHSIFEDPLGAPLFDQFVVMDTYIIDIFLTQPFTSIMDVMCFEACAMISPTAHAVDAQSFIDVSTGDLVGTGPWTYDEYITDQEVRFSRWDGYWGGPSDSGLANFEKMVYEIIDDPHTRNYAMLAHDFDYLEDIITDLHGEFDYDPDITLHMSDTPGLTFNYLVFNNNQINITWRKAMCYAFDYDYMVSDYWQDRVFRSYGPVSAGFGEYYNSAVESVAPYYNITRARMILAGLDPTPNPVPGIPEAIGLPINNDPYDAAWLAADLISFNYSYNTDNAWRADLYTLLSGYYDSIGITVIDGGTDWVYFLYRAYGYVPGGYDELQIFWIGWGPDYLDPINMIQPLYCNESHYNSAQVNDPTLEQMMEDYLAELVHATKVSMMHSISIYLATQLYSHLYGFHERVYTCHLADLNDVSYDLNKYRFYSYPIYSKHYPQITSSGDVSFLEGETGHKIIWNLTTTELDDPMYYIYRDDEFLVSYSWGIDDSVTVNLDLTPAGEHVYRIVVQNGERTLENHVNVNVIPRLQITHPSNISYLQGDTGYNIAWYVIDGSADNAVYYIYNETDLIRSDIWQIGEAIVLNVDGLYEGNYLYRIEVHNDLEFVENTVGVSVFTIPEPPPSEEPPQITINSPTDCETFGSDAPDYDISISGQYNTMWYTLDNGVTNIISSDLTGTINQTEWDNMEDGILTIIFYADNSAGLIGSAEVSVVKHVSGGGSPGVPGYNFIALVGVAIVTTLLIIKKKFKK